MSKITEKIFKGAFHEVTSNFGPRKPIETQYGMTSDFHKGTDYGTNRKKIAQYAIENGVIIKKGKTDAVGNYIRIKYDRFPTLEFIHYHMDSISVNLNDRVDENTLLGYTGTTGMSTGIHLHLGIWDNSKNEYLDPEKFEYEESKTMKFKNGDKVVINGNLYISSYAKEPMGTVENKVTTITRVVEGKAHPYNTTGDLGWMNEEDIKLYEEDYKELYEKELLVNKDLQAQLDIANKKISDAINVLK